MAGSNDLNISLKAQVVKLKVELDAKGSKLPAQVSAISKMLANNPVKLKVKLEAKLGDLNKQIKTISSTLQNDKAFKPLKLKVEIDAKGSAKNIQNQLKDIYKTVEDFNKKYGQQVKQMQEQMNKASSVKGKASSSLNVPTGTAIPNFNNIKQYNAEIKKAQDILNSKFGDGIFKATQFKDAKGNLTGFVAELQKANGIVEKIKYSWSGNKNAFEVINRQTVDNTAKNAQSIQNTLKGLKNEINNLGKGSDKSGLLTQLKDVQKALNTDGGRNFTKQMVADLQGAIKAEQQLAQATKSENQMLQQQAKLIADIKKNRDSAKGSFKNDLNSLIGQANKASKAEDPSLAFKKIRQEMQGMMNEQAKVNAKEKESQAILKETIKLRRQLKDVLKTMPSDDSGSKLKRQMVTEAIDATKAIKTYEQLAQAKKNLQKINDNKWMDNDQNRAKSLIESLKSVQRQFEAIGKTPVKLTSFMAEVDNRAKQKLTQNTQDIRNALTMYQRMLADENRKIKASEKEIRLGQDITAKFGGANSAKFQNMQQQLFGNGTMTNQAIDGLKRYIHAVEGARVASISFGRDGIDQMGKRVRQMSVVFQGGGEHVRKVTYSMTQGSQQIRQVSDEMVRNVNRNLGAWEKLKNIMSTAPLFMLGQQMWMAPIQGLQAMTQEILKVDQAMTELRRVANDSQNVDILFQNSVGLSKELGNNIHDIMKGMSEFTRTFGDFNERQLTAITKTATLMSNVSDLNVEDSQKSLVGTMNAFNIEASDSIRIVDSLNEVDNNYAISTKQLAEGLQKSASAGKTFGVGMEENVGHITAIGAVTMESGAIIGNSLKTIYSRLTTMKDSESTLKNVGVAMYEIGENGEKSVRPVSKILNDLGKNWAGLTAEEQQNTAVKIAGRNQLTRFLALMNNYQMAIDSTSTAYNSQGSAMRENAEYMKSFEARFNQLKNTFTELALSFGDAFLSGGMLAVIEGFTAITQAIISVTQQFGALGTLGFIIAGIATKMGLFKGLFEAFGRGINTFTTGFRTATENSRGFGSTLTGVSAGLNAVGTSAGASQAGVNKLATGFLNFGKSLLAMTGMGLVFMGIGAGVEYLIGKWQEAKREQEELDKQVNQMVDGYRKNAHGMDDLIAKYEKLSMAFENKQLEKGSEQYKEFMEIQSKLASIMPGMVDHIDAEGQAWMRSSDELREQLELTKQLSKAKAEETNLKYEQNIQKQIDSLEKLRKKKKEIEQEEEDNEKFKDRPTASQSRDERLSAYAEKVTQTKIKEAQLNQQILQSQQKITQELTNQARAGLEVDGTLARMSDSAQKVMDNFMKTNSDLIGNAIRADATDAELQKIFDKLTKSGQEVGRVFADNFSKMTEGIDSSTAKGAQQIDEIRNKLNTIGNALPKDFLKVENLGDLDKAKEKIQGVIDLGMKIKDGSSGATLQPYIDSAKKLGMSTGEATQFVLKLAKESELAGLKTTAMAEAQNGASSAMDGTTDAMGNATDATKEYTESIIEAIDATKELYGYKNEEVSAIKGNLLALKQSQDMYGENAKKTQMWGKTVTDLTQRFGVSREEVENNIDKYIKVADTIGQVTYKIDEAGNVVRDYGSLSKSQISDFEAWEAQQKANGQAIDIFSGKVDDGKFKYDQFGNKIKETSDKVKEGGETAKEGGDNFNQAGDSVNQGAEKIAGSGTRLEGFFNVLGKLGEKSGQTGQQVLEGLQKINTADFSQVQSKSAELGISMDKVVQYAKVAGSITPEEMAKIGNSGDFVKLLDDKLKAIGFDEFKQKTGEVAEKAEADMQRTGNSGAPLSILEQKMRDLGFDEFKYEVGTVASETESSMSKAGGSGVQLAPLGSTLRQVQDTLAQTGGKAGEAGGQVQNGLNLMGQSGGGLAPLHGALDTTKGKMDETKGNVEGNVQGINNSLGTLGQGFDTNNRWKTGAQLFNESIQGMAKQSGTSAQEIQGHVTTIGNAGNALDQYKLAVDNVKNSLNGLATEVTGTATGLSQFGMAFAGAGQAMSGFQTSMGAVRAEMSSVVSDAGNTAQSLQSVGDSISNAGNSAGSFTTAMNSVGASCSLASQSMLFMGDASASASQGLSASAQASNASAQASNNNAQAKNSEAQASQSSATASFNVANAKNSEAQAIMSAINATQSMAQAYSAMAQAGMSSISSMIGAMQSYMTALFSMLSGTMSATSGIKSAFSSMVGTVVGSTGAMNSAHSSQVGALNRVKDAANQAKSAVQGLNSTISGAMSSLSSYIAKANEASNVQVKAPSLPPLPTGASWTMQSVTNLLADTGNGEVASAMTNFGTAMSSAIGAFTASSGESGSLGGGGGTSGTIQPSIYSGLNQNGEFGVFKASADESEKLSDPTAWQSYERSMKELDITIKHMEAKMKSMNKSTAEYRKMMNDVYQIEIKRWELLNNDLYDKERRNEQIKRELEGLKNINSHTKEQREQYNKLWSEYESNLSSIQSMRVEWQEFLDNWENRYADILREHVNAIVEEYTKGLERIKSKVDDIEFSIQVAELTDPNNMQKMINLYIDKANQLKQEKAKLEAQQRDLTLKLYEAEDKFGKDSQVAKDVQAEIDKVKEAWEDSTIAVLQAEKEIKDIRSKVAEDGIDKLKNFYSKMKEMAVQAIDKEQDRLKKAHDEKMKLYDKEIEKINSIYDAKFRAMDDKKSEDNYQSELGDKNSERQKLQDKISILSKDSSVGGRKKLAEAQEELKNLDKEIAKFKQERADELLRQALEDQKEQEIKEVENTKEQADKDFEGVLEKLDKEKEAVEKKYDYLIENDRKWAEMKDQFAKGNFETLQNELTTMYMILGQMEAGHFDTLTKGWNTFGDEVKKQIQEMFELDINNMIFENEDLRSDVNEIRGSNGYQMFEGEVIRPTDPARPQKPAPEPPPKPPVTPPTGGGNNGGNNSGNTGVPSKGTVTGVDANSYLNIRSSPDINSGISRRILNGSNVQILGDNGEWWKVRFSNSRGTTEGYANKKYIKAFDTGGYTGDWAGNDGKMAMLHKKEQVLNQNDTKNLFDTVKLVDKMKEYLPQLTANNVAGKFANEGGVNINNHYELTVNIESMNGTKEQAKSVSSEIIKGLRKMGK
ncbi:tail length tape measure protein [Bacillus phage vB_BanS_Nate]|uniref:Tape measure protein n=1 Tax=Bacillus phage vB_BanS_Nate TaxID=2894788 RepID=A0AAE9CEB6_9CAUD|nr:tail length tape measure protein [Bacillus phage vB_BanS_Nate]UGO51069.1 tape measure protein [Bacillus phage vB_BanS_Nate]